MRGIYQTISQFLQMPRAKRLLYFCVSAILRLFQGSLAILGLFQGFFAFLQSCDCFRGPLGTPKLLMST